MESSLNSKKKKIRYKNALRYLTFVSITLFSNYISLAQPVWNSGPTITAFPIHLELSFNLDRPSIVYYFVVPGNYTGAHTPASVKAYSIQPLPYGAIIDNAGITYSGGAVGNNYIHQIYGEIASIQANQTYTLYVVAEEISTGILSSFTRVVVTTLPCPKIDVLTGFTQPILCVNKGATAVFKVTVDDPPNSGILKGTTWFIDWGDGNSLTYTSTADFDVPPLATRTHTYLTVTSCNYVFSNTIRNPCGETRSVQYIAVVHGREIASDGNGMLQIVNNATGSTTIQVCAGTQSTITIRDNSTWNCQNPVLPGGFTAVPNTDPRNIEWLYGRDPGGAATNTITGPVAIATMGNAPQFSGRFSPIPYGPTSLSKAITIPATCKAGEYFRVYMKEWNKCNWTDPEYLSTFVDINVIAAPAAPTVPSRTICFGDDGTLTVTSTPVGTLTWYSDAALTTSVETGSTYVPSQTAPGIYNFWVTDQSLSGLQCISPARQVSLTIREDLSRPSTITGPSNTCPGVSGLTFSVTDVPPVNLYGGATEYVWSVPSGLSIASGQGSRQITVNVDGTSGNRTISVYLRYTSAPVCNSNSRSKTLSVYSTTHDPGTIAGSGVCPGGTVNITSSAAATTGNPSSTGPTYSWDRAPGPGFSVWTSLAGTGATFSETMAATGTYRYRRTAAFGCGSPVSTTVDIPVYSTVHDPGVIAGSNICAGATVSISSTTAATTGSPASSGPIYSWDRSVSPFSSWTGLSGSGATFSQTMATPGVYRYRRTATFGCGTAVSITVDITVYSTTHDAGAIAGTDICPGGTVNITSTTAASTGTPASSGPTYTWQRAPGPGFTAWSNLTGSASTYSETNSVPGTYRYRRTAAFGCGSSVSATVDINVFSITHNAGAISGANACAGSTVTISGTTAATTGTPASSGPTYSWERAPGPGYSSWTARPGTGASLSETVAAAGTYRYRRTATFGCGTAVSTTADVTIYSTANAAGAIAGTNICTDGTVSITNATSASTGTPASSGPTYSWDRAPGPGFSTWTTLTGSAATFSETMATDGTYRYRRTATFGCGSALNTTTDVIVNPLPAPVVSGFNNVCQHPTNTVSYTTASIAGHTYLWTVTLGSISGADNNNTVNVIWNTAGAGTVTVTETITATNCSKTTPAYSVTVNPGPPTVAPAYVSGATNICRNGTLNLDVTDAASAAEYIWDYSWVAGTNNATTTTSQISIDLTGIAPGSYSVTVAGSNGCGTGPWMAPAHSFNINDIPDLASLSNTVCSDNASAITLSISNAGPTITGLTYNIVSINMNGLTASAGAPATGTGLAANVIADDAYTNKTSANVNVIYAVVPVSSEGCPGAQEDVILTVRPEPVLAALNTTKCSDDALGFSLSVAAGSSSAASYNITSINANGLTASAGSPASGTGLAANVIADDAWRNTTNAAVNVVYSIVPVGTNGCTGDTYTMIITVNPEPILAVLDATKCSDEALGFNLAVATGSVAASTYNITAINANGLTASAGAPATGTGLAANVTANDAWTNTTANPVNVVYTVVPVSAAGCQGDPKTVTIIVNPEPTLATLTNTVCSDAASAITLAVSGSSVAATTFNITAINNGGLTASAGSPATGNGLLASVIADDAWTNKTNGNVNVVYTVVPVSAAGCAGNPVDVTVTVRPEPVLAVLDAIKCSDEALGFNLSLASGSSPATLYNITAINSNGLTASAGAPAIGSGLAANVIADDAWTNTTTAAVNVVYSVVPVGTNGCPGDTRTMTITVNPEPVLATLDATKCSDEVLGFNLAVATGSVAASTYNITTINANGLTASAGGPATGNGLLAAVIANDAWTNTTAGPVNVVYTVVPVSATGCPGDPKTVTITVNPEPVLASLDATKCSDEVLGFNLAVATGSVAASTYNITSVNSNGLTASAGSPATGTGLSANVIADDAWTNTNAVAVNVIYTVVPVSASGCQGNARTVTITVNPEPVMATPGATKCSREAFGFNLSVNAGGVAASTYNITSINSNGLTASAGAPASGTGLAANIIADDAWINTTSANVNVVYTVVPVSAAGCQGNPSTITVIIKPEPVITAGQSASACSGNALNYAIGLDNFTNPADNVTFTWPAPVLNPVSASFTGGLARSLASSANITDTYINTLGIVGTARYTVTPFKGGCAGLPVVIVINIGSEPVLDPGLNKTICSNVVTGLILKEAAGSVTPTYYNITGITIESGLTAVAGNAVIPNATAPATFLANDRFTNFTGVNKTVTYHVQPILAPDCIGDAVDVVITIRPQPVILAGQTATVCSGVAIGKEIKLFPANTPPGTIFNWNAPFMSDASVQGTAGVNVAAGLAGTIHINDIINNYSSAPITAIYTITPTSSFGCAGDPVPVVITINQEPLPLPISGRVNLCVGDNPVVYTVNPVGGSSFHWTVSPAVGITTFDFNTNAILITAANAAGSGNISVYETNSLACSGDPSTLAVQVYAQPAPENISGDAFVCTLSTHSYSVTNRTGSVYTWTIPGGAYISGNPSASSISVTFGNVGGTILVRETNIAGCVTNHNPFSVSVTPLPTATISNGGTLCDGGTRPLNVTFNGTAPFSFTYAINGVSQTPVSTSSNPYTLNATLAGTYTIVNVTDNTGCTNTGSGSAFVTYFPKPTGIISGNAELCRGSSATITITFTGVAPFTFTYTDGTSPVTVTAHPSNVYTASVSPLVSSTYTLTSLTDFNNCSGVLSGSAAINVNQPPSLSLAGTNLICYNVHTGAVDLTISGGTAPFGRAWTGPNGFTSPTEDISGLAEGYYAVTVTDSRGCVATANITLTQPPVLNAAVAYTNATCSGANDGTITISGATGGTGTFEYTIDGTAWQGSGTFANLAPGNYNVQVRDLVNPTCTLTLNPALAITQQTGLSATVTKTDIICFNAHNGSIIISNPAGGHGIYQYTIDGTTWVGSGSFTNLASGSYNVIIRDAVNNACALVLNPALVITEVPVLSATVNSTSITCFGASDGIITISGAAGGSGTYEYSINGGGSWQATGSFPGLTPGSYNILMRDAAYTGCIIVLNNAFLITQPGMLSATITKTEVSCHGDNDGTISIISPSGGSGTYEYSVDGGFSWQSSGNYTGLATGTYNIRLRDAANAACSGILNPNLVITEPIALSMFSTGDILLGCFGDIDGIGTFYASGGTMPYTFVVVSNTTGGTVASSGFNSSTFFNAGTGSITMSVVDFNGCSVQATINITQPADLNPGTIASDQIICYGDNPAMLTQASAPAGGPGGYSFQWQSSTNMAGPFVNIAGATINQYTPPAGASYTIYYRRMVTSGTCMPVYSNIAEVLVNPRPVALLTGGETICPGQSSVIRVTMLAGTGPFTVDIANYGTVTNYTSGADIVVTPASTTTYTLARVRDSNNCEVVSPSTNLNGSAKVTVSDLPVIASFAPSPPVCEFALANFKVTATGTNLTYQWFVNEGSGFNAVVDGGTYFGAMTPTLQIFNTVRTMKGFVYHAVASGCGTSVTTADAVFTVNTAPEITLHPKDSTICLDQNAVLEADAAGTSVTWQWYVNKGSGFVLSVDGTNFSGSQTKTLTITNAQAAFNGWVFRAVATGVCGVPVNTSFAVLRVVNPPAVTIQPGARTICENGSTSFLANGTGYTSLQWQVFSGGAWTDLAENATYIGTNTRQLAIINAPLALNASQFRLTLITGCATTYTNGATLTVNANPVVDFGAVNPIQACGGVPVELNGNPTGGSGSYTQHRWTGDVGPLNNYNVQSPTFNSQITAIYSLNYRVTDSNGCTDNDNVTITVDSPSAQFTDDADFGCAPLNVTFTKDMTGLGKWWWNFDDGSPLDSLNANPVHTFINSIAGSIEYYNVRLKVRSTGGCYAEYTHTITVYPAIDATFAPNVTTVCSGSSITFTALSGGSKYFWEYGDGASGYSTNLSTHLYTNFTTDPVVHTVRLTTTSFYNCVDVKTFDITVMPVPVPQFTADPVTQVFKALGNPVTFTNTTNTGTWNWLWRFGDNSTSTDMNPVHNYTDVGTYSVTLIAGNANCSDSVKHNVSVVPPGPFADFDSIPSGCAPLYVNITNTSINTEVPGTTYRWDFGDGSISTAKNPTYTYFTAGSYRIELVVTGPGGNSMATQVVNAYPSPKAYFEVTPPVVYVNDERVRCFNLSQGANSYLWDFGDGDTSKVREPYHRYMEEGVFDITLWAYSENGCTDMYILSPAVTVEPVGVLRFSTVFMPNKTGPIERSDLPTGGYEADQFFYPPVRQKVLNYKLQVFNRLGVLIFQSDDINVPWNGYYKGILCQQGVYVWYVEGKYADGKPFKLVGNVTLLQ